MSQQLQKSQLQQSQQQPPPEQSPQVYEEQEEYDENQEPLSSELKKKQQEEGKESPKNTSVKKKKKVKKQKSSIKKQESKEYDPQLLEWAKQKLETLSGFEQSKHWNHQLEGIIGKLFLDSSTNKLFVWADDKIYFSIHQPPVFTDKTNENEFIFFLKTTNQAITIDNINQNLFFKKVQPNHLKSLLNVMNNYFIPKLIKDQTWPDNVKKEFLAQLHKFMSSLTEICYQMEGYTELYIPNQDLNNVDGQDKDLIQRLEATIINWTKQIREIVNNTDSQHQNQNSGPLDEIQYWRSRRQNLKHIDQQLEKPELKQIVKFLERVDSTYAKGFASLTVNIKNRAQEASNNLMFLQSLFQPCKSLESVAPKDIPELLPNLLMRVRMIWEHSKFYKSNERISGLLHKISNEIIKRCKQKINVEDMLDGDVEKCIEDLKDSITCGRKWRTIYDKTASTINKKATGPKWDFSSNSIFAQVEAFVQRCSQLIEICQGQLQFAMRGSGMQMPKFGGSRASEIINILLQIKASFRKLIDKFRSSQKEKILDVKASTWHDEYNSFKAGMKQLDVMYQNVIDYSFKQVTTVQQGVQMLQAFDYLAKRQSIKMCVRKKANEILNLFEAEFQAAKHENEQRKNIQYPLHHGKYSGHAIFVRSLIFRIQKLRDSIDKLYFIDDNIKNSKLEKYNQTYKTLQSVIKQQKLNSWKQENKTYEDLANLNRSIQNTTILCKPDENHEDYKLQEILKPRPLHLECNFDRKLLKLMVEVNAWKILIPFNVRIPNDPDEFTTGNQQNLRVLREYSMIVVRDYNTIIDFMDDTEKKLFAQHLQLTDKTIQPGISRFKWSSKSNVDSFLVRSCKGSCNELFNKLKMFKSNTKKIEEQCQQISKISLIALNKKQFHQVSVFETDQINHRKQMLIKLQGIFNYIFNILCATYQPFEGSRRQTQLVWFGYIKDIDKKIEQALKKSVKNSLLELYKVIGDPEKNIQPIPIFTLSVELQRQQTPKLAYKPTTNVLVQNVNSTISAINGVVDQFKTMQQLMLAVYKKKKKEKMEKLEKQKNPLKKIVEEEQIKISEQSYYSKVSKDHDIQKYGGKIIANLGKVASQVLKDTSKDKWINSQLLWPDQRRERYTRTWIEQNWTSITAIRQFIENFDIQNQQIQGIKSLLPIQCIVLNNSNFKHALSQIVIFWQNSFMIYLQERCVQELKYLHEVFRSSQANLSPDPQDLHQLKKNTDLWQKLMDSKKDFESKLEPLKDKLAELDSHSIQLKQEEVKLRLTLMDSWKNFNDMLAQIQKRNIRIRSTFHNQTTKNLEQFTNQTVLLKANFNSNAPFQSNIKNEKAFNILNEYTQSVKNLRARWNDMKFGFDLFEINYSSPGDLDGVDKQIKNLENIWGLRQEWDRKYQNQIKDIKFKDVDSQKLEEFADDFNYKIQQFSKQQHIKRWDVVLAFKTSIQNFKSVLPLIQALRQPYMRPRHWQQLQKSIEFDQESPLFTFDQIFIQKNFLGYADVINNVCQVAREQYKIESALQKIQKKWSNLDLQMQPYKKTWKIRATDPLFSLLQDHMGTLSNQKTGLFYQSFKDQIQTWQQKLQLISETLDQFIQVQRQWIYLQAIFASQQDQDKQLIGDISKFQVLNGRLSTHMQRIHNNRNILVSLLVPEFLPDLQDISKKLDQSQKILFSLLERKRRDFPRFYFLANDDLFELLGNSKDPSRVNKHIKKCFQGIKKLTINSTVFPGRRNNDTFIHEVVQLVSPQQEIVKLTQKVVCENGVETWIKGVQKMMRDTLKKNFATTFNNYSKKKDSKLINDWIENHHGQLLIAASQLIWTNDCEAVLRLLVNSDKPDKSKLWKGLREEKSYFLTQLTKLVRKATKNVSRLKLIALITIQVHARDITQQLSKTCFSNNSFEWKKQLRFSGQVQGDTLECNVEQTNTKFPYGYQYQGNNGRLVVTALTDRCYMTLTTAMHLKKGGAPQGPAGTGKTETVKDLGKGMAKFVLVFNCSQGLDYKSLGRMFSGLMQTGGWGCFDQFNRIELEVLSVVAQQMLSILNALKQMESKKGLHSPQNPYSFNFEDSNIPANDQCAIFITMNPGYAGRTELPDNLKSLFRPMSMMVPQSNIICQIMLSSEGFKNGKMLSTKMVVLYSLMSQQLSKQDHYDFGLRAIKSVLTCAGAIRRQKSADILPEKIDKKDKEQMKQLDEKQLIQETQILMRAIRDMNLPKFVAEDIPLFNSLFQDLFPNTQVNQVQNTDLVAAIEQQLKQAKLVIKPEQIRKIIQLYDSKNTRHGNMLVGASLSGKSTCWKILKNALNNLNKKFPDKYPGVKLEVLNPKTVDLKELFGYVDGNLQWSQGVLSSMMSRLCKQESNDQRWMILDGPVDTLWIESMNTVLDDNKVLTLLNGDRIALPPQVGLVFEVQDLAVASPATVSRAGMVFLNLNELGWKPYIQSWISKIKDEQVQQFLTDNVQKLLPKLFAKKRANRDSFKQLIPTLEVNIAISFTKLLDAFVASEAKTLSFTLPNKTQIYWNLLQKWFTFCIIWSFGATLDQNGRRYFDGVIRDMESMFPSNLTVFDYYINMQKNQWAGWEQKISATIWKPPASAPYHKMLVPTVDSARNRYVLMNCVLNRIQTLSVGVTGTGKTVLINEILSELDQTTWKTTNIIFSSQTSSLKTQEMIQGKLTRRAKTKMVPDGKKMAIYVDDLNMPKKDTFGSQPPLELIRQWMDYEGWFDRQQKQIFKKIEDIQFIASMGPPGGGRAQISRRIVTKFNLINFTFPNQTQVRRIFQSILSYKFQLQQFEDQIKQLADTLSLATLNLYLAVSQNFLPTPAKSHYVFNMRDISKVIQGIYVFDKFYCDSKLTMLRLWVHESLRVFHDRLVSVDDRNKLKKLVGEQLQQSLQSNMKECTDENENDTIFVDFFDQTQDRQIYIEVPFKQRDQLKKIADQKLHEFNQKFKSSAMNIVLFEQALSYICKIHRIIKFSKGHGMLIGEGGAGRHSLTKLACFIAKYNLHQTSTSKSYRLKQFRENIKQWSQDCGYKGTSGVLMFSDNQITQESFIEDINTILTIGQIPNLFSKEDFPTIKQKMKKIFNRRNSKQVNVKDEVLLEQFFTKIQNNFHIMFLMSKTGDNLRNYCRMYPGLVNNTTMIWFMPWPAEALVQVANKSLMKLPFDQQTRKSVATFFGNAHTKVMILAERMLQQLKRLYYVTPTNYIELVKGYTELLHEKQDQIGGEISKLSNGLFKLDEAQSNSNQIQKNLAILQNQLAKKSKDCEELLIKIDRQSRDSKQRKNQVTERQIQVNKEKAQIQILKAQAQVDLKKAEPALYAAEQGLSNLTKDKLSIVKSYATPPAGVDVVLNAVMLLINREPNWAVAKKELADTSFLTNLQKIDKGRIPTQTLRRIEKLTQDPKMSLQKIDTISEAAGGLWRWVLAIEGYAKAFKDIQPKKIKCNNLQQKLKKSEEQLNNLRQNFDKLKNIINVLNESLDKAKSDMDGYQRQAQQLQLKLQRAEKLINGLASTKEGWQERKKKLEEKYGYLVGDALMSAAFLSYAGPFPSQYRELFVKNELLGQVKLLKINHSKDYSFPEFLIKPIQFIRWQLKGLPDDGFSKQNGVLVKKGRMFPLLIDPQLQGNKWIKDMQKQINKDKLFIIDPQTQNFMSVIQKSVAFGNIVIFQNLQQQIDPALQPLLNKTIKKVAGGFTLYLGERQIKYSQHFRFYMTTKLPNPKFKAQVTTKVTLVNFTVKQKGLEEQLNSVVIRKMQFQLENNKNDLVKNKSENQQLMKKLDDDILKTLSATKTNLIDDQNIIDNLHKSKETEEKVRHQIESSATQMKKILAARENYRKLAKTASKLFFIINDFSLIETMYQFALDSYISLFEKTIKQYIEKPGLNDSLQQKLDAIAQKHKTSAFRYACRGLFEKDKLLLGLMMTVKLKEIDQEEYNFFLRGSQNIVDRKGQVLNQNEWIQQNNWNAICDLQKLPNFTGIIGAFTHNSREWKRWYMSAQPEKQLLPGQWNQKCDSLRKMIITKIIRKDRVLPAAVNFIIEKNGSDTFVTPPNFSLESVFGDSNKNTPIIFILSPGVDPYPQLKAFADSKQIQLMPVSLGQGQAKKAKQKVFEGAKNGTWLYLANCHLSLNFLKDLEKILETFDMNKQDINQNFRLWLSTNPHPKFPISILQKCIKITTQPPKGVKANMLRLYSNMPKEFCPPSVVNKSIYKRSLFALCWFHALIIERKRFKTLGWNIIYDFNDSDWDTADKILQLYVDQTQQTKTNVSNVTGQPPNVVRTPPWDAVRFLISEVTYGGRVTDEWDRRLLNVYAAQLFNQKVVSQEKHRLGDPNVNQYIIPEDLVTKDKNVEKQGEAKYYHKKILEQFPSTEKPEAFGQHINAQISSQIADTNSMLESISTLESRQLIGGQISIQSKVKQMITDLLSRIDQQFDMEQVFEKVKPQDQQPLKIVLVQEISRYNKLLETVRKSLINLDKGMSGLVLISEELQIIMNCLYENKVPEKWKFAYHSLKPLSAWVLDLNKRIDQLRTWVNKGQPNVFWISGFSFPTGFTTALQQQASRKLNVSIDQFSWQFLFEKMDTSITYAAKQGAYIEGLYLEGAKWDGDKNCIAEPEPMKLYYKMPIIQFRPVYYEGKQKIKKGQNFYQCPTYMYPLRTGIREKPSFMFTVQLPCKPNPNNVMQNEQDFWIKRGTALLMSLASDEI